MGLFSRKEKEIEYDVDECKNKKEIMRKIFNELVEDGESFEILHATQTTSKFERGFIADTTTTSFYHYILGYRKSDNRIIMVQVNRALEEYTEAFEIDMSAVIQVSYDRKYTQVCLKYRKDYDSYGEILDIGDTGNKTMYGISNTMQKEEREKFLDYLENLRSKLEVQGFKQGKWKR